MKAIKITTKYNERHKLAMFMPEVEDDETFAYLIDETTAIIVSASERGMSYIEETIPEYFDEYDIDHIK